MILIIVESPKKAKAIGEFLKSKPEYKVISSQGHIRTLSKKQKAVEVTDELNFTWEPTVQWQKISKELLTFSKEATKIILATDQDREGEAIAWHLTQVLKEKQITPEFKRITFNAITKEMILKALKNEGEVNLNLVNAYLTRTALDHMFGFGVSPILWRKVPCCKSAGRVQSVALRLIVEKENEILNFVKTKFYTILAEYENIPILATLTELNGTKYEHGKIYNVDFELDKFKFKHKIIHCDKKEHKIATPAPLITSTLQQTAFTHLNFNTEYTMQLAQKLYEGFNINNKHQGLITYMRTDNIFIIEEEVLNIRKAIVNHYGQNYLQEEIIHHKNKVKNAQEAHEAIRPVDITITTNDLIKNKVDKDVVALYDLIWKHTLASQAKEVVNEIITLTIEAKDEKNHALFELKHVKNLFLGFKKILNEEVEDINHEHHTVDLHFEVNTMLIEKQLIVKEHETAPPKRYNEATLIKQCQKLGIGRPSTYARICKILFEREYVQHYKKSLKPTNIGWIVIGFLKNFFQQEIEYDFTSHMEDQLDNVSNNLINYFELIKNFHENLKLKIGQAMQNSALIISHAVEHTFSKYFMEEEKTCHTCSSKLLLKFSKIGSIKGCEKYPECKFFIPFSENVNQQEHETQILGNVDCENIEIKHGPFGPYVQNSMKKVSIPKEYHKNLAQITLEKALFLLSLPLKLGEQEKEDIMLKNGKFGPYLEYKKKFYSIKNIFEMSFEKAQAIISKKEQ